MKGKLTKRAVDSFSPTQKVQFLWDTELPGFGLKVTPQGRKTYLLQYRMEGGRSVPTRRYVIGPHGPLTPDGARIKAKGLIGDITKGIDPVAEKTARTHALTLSAFAERYLAEYAVPHKKPGSVTQDRRNLRNHILPSLGSRRLETITRSDIAKLHYTLKDTPIAANRVLAVLTKMFNLAGGWGLRGELSNPCRHVPKYKEIQRERFLSEQELARLGEVLRKAETTVSTTIMAAIRLLIFTGARLGEILTLRWNQIDLERQSVRLADSKTGPKTIYLNPAALSVLITLQRIEGNPYVLPGQKEGSHIVNVHKTWHDIRKEAELDGVRLHDLRHSFASVGAVAGLSLPILGALLGHSKAATTQRYAHLSADPLKHASTLISDKIQAALSGTPKAPVVPITRRKRA